MRTENSLDGKRRQSVCAYVNILKRLVAADFLHEYNMDRLDLPGKYEPFQPQHAAERQAQDADQPRIFRWGYIQGRSGDQTRDRDERQQGAGCVIK
ncbi:hypothetical protein D3C81_1446270 [compost metagenome]